MDYSELAKQQFDDLKEETLNEDRHSLGAENERHYEIDGAKFKIRVEGFWEKATWFDWFVYDEEGNETERGSSL